MNPNPQTTPPATQDAYTLAFLNTLVMAILGYSINDIPEDKKQSTILECVTIFNEFITSFVEIKYGKVEATRLKAAQNFQDPKIFTKFAELGDIYEEAYTAFTKFLSNRWDKKTQKLQQQV
jgi:hypothetical protein